MTTMMFKKSMMQTKIKVLVVTFTSVARIVQKHDDFLEKLLQIFTSRNISSFYEILT